jgi:hypothetical protein
MINLMLFFAERIDLRQNRRHRSPLFSTAVIKADVQPNGFLATMTKAPKISG